MQASPQQKPSAWVMRFAARIPSSGKILDLACGRGRHLRALRGRNQPLVVIDIDLAGVADLDEDPVIKLQRLDLESRSVELPDTSYAGIIVTNYLHRPLLPELPGYLAPGGVLIYETFAAGNEAFGKPANPDYLLEPDELLNIFSARLHVEAYEHGYTEVPRPAIMQKICAINPA
jgi:SAM-dependent methyltransferase